MNLTFPVLILLVTISIVWVFIEVKRLKHKLFAIFLIGLILFSYFSFSFVFSGRKVDLTSVRGIIEAGEIYLSWLGNVFSNIKVITSSAIKMDWKLSQSQNSSEARIP